jgi:pSer/pThr/pTyr-binding forkhead associated (FHA) protein
VQPGYAAPPPPPRPVTGAPPPLPAPPPTAAPGSAPGVGSPLLYVIFNGQKYPVNKEEFIIGRGAKTADLPIKDGNISRRHAAIIFQNGAYYMKDLGSTNGVEYQGRRVDGRHIQEGDVYQLCDYELRFTYR